MRIFVLLLMLIGLAAPLAAQDSSEDDQGFLERKLQEVLSAAGREVRITGFSGALSSRAQVERMTISDADGVWLTLRDAELIWTRRALFAGRLEVDSLRAREIEIARLPTTERSLEPADAEVTPFALPELPVSVNINQLDVERIALAEPVLGEPASLSVTGDLRLAGGEGAAKLDILRTDRDDSLLLDAAFSNETRVLRLDVDFSETADGLVSGLLGIPGAPSLDLEIAGDAPLSDFTAQVGLSSDGARRFGGEVTVRAGRPEEGGHVIAAELDGDVRPLFAAQFHPFFGSRARLAVDLRLPEDGRTLLDNLELDAGGFDLAGSLALASDGWPERFDLQGQMGDGTPMRLPAAEADITVERLRIDASFDAAAGDSWTADIALTGLQQDTLSLGAGRLQGQGRITRAPDEAVMGALDFSLTALDPGDDALRRAIGDNPSGRTRFDWRPDAPLRIEELALQSGDMSLTADATLNALADGFPLDGTIRVLAGDISRFSTLAGRDLAGVAIAEVTGEVIPLSGAFDVVFDARTQDLVLSEPRLDPLIGGETRLEISAKRDETGLRLRGLDLSNDLAAITGEGVLSGTSGLLDVSARLSDIALVEPKLDGDADLRAQVAWQDDAPVRLSVFDARLGQTTLVMSGLLDPDDPALPASGELQLVSPDLSRFAAFVGRPLAGRLELDLEGDAEIRGETFDLTFDVNGTSVRSGIETLDRMIAGDVSAAGSAALEAQAVNLRYLQFNSPQLRANASSEGPGQPVALSVRLNDLGLFTNSISGPAEVSGTLTPRDRLARDVAVAVQAQGPGGLSAQISGDVRDYGQVLSIRAVGTGPLQLANRFLVPRSIVGDARFDLALSGPPRLTSLSGQASFAGARLALPEQSLVLDDLNGEVALANGSAGVTLSGHAGQGGRFSVSGPIALQPPFSADLAIRLSQLGLSDGQLFETSLNGDLSVVGPLTGGARIGGVLDLGRTELRIPSGSGTIIGTLPQLRHSFEPAAVNATRRRAGLISDEEEGNGNGGGVAFPLDVTVNAPNQIFVRGRGLDAELGGSIRLTGTTEAVVPSGFFELIRGRFEILARRLDLTEGLIDLRGGFDAFLRFVAEATVDSVVLQVLLEGQASEPTITFSSSPELPEEEVVARLIFGRGLDNISAFQAAQLVSAVAQLTGRYDGGVVGKLRNSLGLTDLDVSTSDDGAAQVSAGTYIADNVYSEVTADSDGKQQINLNLDVSDSVTVRGRADSEGETGLGIFFERDY